MVFLDETNVLNSKKSQMAWWGKKKFWILYKKVRFWELVFLTIICLLPKCTVKKNRTHSSCQHDVCEFHLGKLIWFAKKSTDFSPTNSQPSQMLVKKLWKRSFPGPVYRTYIHIFFATLVVITSVLEVRPDHSLKVNRGSFSFTDAKKMRNSANLHFPLLWPEKNHPRTWSN